MSIHNNDIDAILVNDAAVRGADCGDDPIEIIVREGRHDVGRP